MNIVLSGIDRSSPEKQWKERRKTAVKVLLHSPFSWKDLIRIAALYMTHDLKLCQDRQMTNCEKRKVAFPDTFTISSRLVSYLSNYITVSHWVVEIQHLCSPPIDLAIQFSLLRAVGLQRLSTLVVPSLWYTAAQFSSPRIFCLLTVVNDSYVLIEWTLCPAMDLAE